MEFAKNLSKNIRALRGEKSLTEFSEELAITKTTLRIIEQGVSNVRLDTLELICEKTGVSVNTLLDGELGSTETKILFHVLRSLEWFAALSESEQAEVLRWAHETLMLFSKLSLHLNDHDT